MRTRAFLMVWTIGLVATPAVQAFSKLEHEQLTCYAFEHVRARACPGERDGASASPVSPPSPRAEALCKVDIQPPELALLTSAVDHFTYPMRLAPRPEACQSGKREDCRKEVLKEDECKAGSFSFPECGRKAWEVTRKKVEDREGGWLYRFLAVHRNDEHFRCSACTSFNEMHQRAMALAASEAPELALYAEAVAVHFLQDVMAPGHLAAPRDQFGDWQAGAVHDRHNRSGLPVTVAREVCVGVARLVEGEAPTASACEDERIPAGKRFTWERLREDLAMFAAHCGDKPNPGYTAHGDRSLLPKVPVPDARLHAATVFYLTVAALEDLYGIADDGRAPVWMFYERPYYDLETGEPRAPELGFRTSPELMTAANGGPAHQCDRGRREPPPSCPRLPASAEALFAYEVDADSESGEPLLDFDHPLNTVQIAYSTWGDTRRRWELAWDVVAAEELVTLLASGSYDNGALGPGPGRRYLGVGSLALHHEQLQDNDVWGLGMLFTYSWQFTKYRDFDVYVGVEPGMGAYRLDGDSTTRIRNSLRAGIGLSVIAGEVFVEHGRSLDRGGSADDEWRWSMNVRLRVSPTWLRRSPIKGLGRKGSS